MEAHPMNQHLHGPVLAHMNLSFTTTVGLSGPVVRVAVDELARVTNLDVPLIWGPLVTRDLALALLGSAGATAAEIHGVNHAFEAELARALGTPAQTAPVAVPAVTRTTPVRAPTPAHGAAASAPTPVAPTVPAVLTASHAPELTYDERRAIAEKAKIIETLDACDGNKSEAAAAMGMARRTFYRRLKEYGLMRDDEPVPSDTGEHTAVEAPAPVRKVGRPKQRAV